MTAEIRELLELAAQAAGIEGVWERDPTFVQERWRFNIPYNNQGLMTAISWNPLESGDDLIDLMDKRSIDPRWNKDYVTAFIYDESKFVCETLEYFAYHPTRKAALAMAVLRCAAEYQRRKG